MDILRRNNVHVLGSSGPVLLYAHDFGCQQTMWSRITPAFADGYRQVLFDYVGSGKSDLAAFDSQRYSSLQGYAQDLLELMDQNYIGWAQYLAPVVSGESQGAPASVPTAELTDSFCSTDPVVARVFAQTTFFADNRADLPQVTRPCLVLQHRVDALAPLSVGYYMHHHLQGSSLQILDITGHCGHMSHPAEVIAAIRNYLPHAKPAA